MVGSVPIEPKTRFFRRIKKMNTGCWEWTAGRFKNSGYGNFNAGKLQDGKWRTCYAHRFSYEIHIGPIPEGMQVLHRCDNRGCVNPDHLFLGTQRDNIHDMFRKGRQRPRGVAKLSIDKAREIRAIRRTFHAGETQQIAEKYGVSPGTIREVWRGERWNEEIFKNHARNGGDT